MEPHEESTTLSPKESIVNILGRLFNNGHITGDELAMMQMELVARNPAPAEPSIGDVLHHELFQDLLQRSLLATTESRRLREAAGLEPSITSPPPLGLFSTHGTNPYQLHSTPGLPANGFTIPNTHSNGIIPEHIDLNGHTKI